MSAPRRKAAGNALRWYVHRVYGRPARFGEALPTLVWVVTPIIGGTGSEGIRVSSDLPFNDRAAALNFAHRLAARTYPPQKDRS